MEKVLQIEEPFIGAVPGYANFFVERENIRHLLNGSLSANIIPNMEQSVDSFVRHKLYQKGTER